MRLATRREFLHAAAAATAGRAFGMRHGSSSSGSGLVITSTHVPSDSKPDGNLNKPMWLRARPVWFDQAAFSDVHYEEFRTKVLSCWSAQFLYLAFSCPYETLTLYDAEEPAPERDRLWERDVVEAFISPSSESSMHYYEFEVAPNNQWLDLEIDLQRKPINSMQWNSGFEHATRIDTSNRHWTAELKIPVRSFGIRQLSSGMSWKVNFYRCDGPGDDNERRMMSWGRLPVRVRGGTYHQPQSFGTLQFENGT